MHTYIKSLLVISKRLFFYIFIPKALKMIKRYFIVIVLLISYANAMAQSDDVQLTTKMLETADDMGQKFIAKDYKGFLKYSHPAVIKSMGGEQKMYTRTVDEIKAIQEAKISFISIKFGVPSKIVKAGNELQSIIPQMIEMNVPGGRQTNFTSLIAISPDNGNKWYFLDTAGNNLQTMKLLVPSLSDELEIPFTPDPLFEETTEPGKQ